MRIAFFRGPLVILPLLILAACNRGSPSNEAIRQGLLDHLKGTSVNVAAMDMDVTSVEPHGDQADVTVTFKPKGGPAAQGMALHYRMQEKSGRWAVVSIQDSAHASTAPGASNPHAGGGALPPASHGEMPSPEDLPPTGHK